MTVINEQKKSYLLQEKKNKIFIITVDGTAGSGKGTNCAMLAELLKINYLDTGLIYRITGFLKNQGKSLPEIIKGFNLGELAYFWQGGKAKLIYNSVDITDTLRTNEVAKLASQIALSKENTVKIFEICRQIGFKLGSVIIDGRNGYTEMFNPEICAQESQKMNVDVVLSSFYLDASPYIRAERRRLLGRETFRTAYEMVSSRDKADMTREIAPLYDPSLHPEVIYIDTGKSTINENTLQVLYKLPTDFPGLDEAIIKINEIIESKEAKENKDKIQRLKHELDYYRIAGEIKLSKESKLPKIY
jgi:cytidylate kinase